MQKLLLVAFSILFEILDYIGFEVFFVEFKNSLFFSGVAI
jgi:hypothetical protein